MRHLQTAAVFTVLDLSVIALFTSMPVPLKGALMMLAFWMIGANFGCFLADRGER